MDLDSRRSLIRTKLEKVSRINGVLMNLRLSLNLLIFSLLVTACTTARISHDSASTDSASLRAPSSDPGSFSVILTALLDVHVPKHGVGITYVYKTNSSSLLEITCAVDVTLSRAMVVSLANGPSASLPFDTRKDCNAMAGMHAGLVTRNRKHA